MDSYLVFNAKLERAETSRLIAMHRKMYRLSYACVAKVTIQFSACVTAAPGENRTSRTVQSSA